MEFIQIEVRARAERGSAAMQRLRRAGDIPGVLYGLQRSNLPITIPGAELERFIRSGSHLVELTMGDESRDAILREVQQDPLTDQILHVDLVRVDKDARVETQVPVTYKGTAPGTREGGLFQSLMDGLRVEARPRDLPEQIVIDVTELHVGDGINVRDVPVPEGASILDADDDLIAHVVAIRGREEDEAEETAEEGADEPEVIGKEDAEERAEG